MNERNVAVVEFDTTPFEFSHGKLPRGYGSWAFSESRDQRDPFFAPTSTYADAKKYAKQQMIKKYGPRCRGTLYVCS